MYSTDECGLNIDQSIEMELKLLNADLKRISNEIKAERDQRKSASKAVIKKTREYEGTSKKKSSGNTVDDTLQKKRSTLLSKITELKQEKKIKTIIGPALENINDLKKKEQKFDLVFIDADKENYKNYYNQSLDLIEKNGLIIVDNVLWHGEVVDMKKQDKLTTVIREFNTYVNRDKRTENLIIPVGDGLTVCRKL